jgi:hypothetical protein
MIKSDDSVFTRHTIIGISAPNGQHHAKEVIVNHSPEHGTEISAVPGTIRTLPLSYEEARKWVGLVLPNISEDEQRAKIEMLCDSNQS